MPPLPWIQPHSLLQVLNLLAVSLGIAFSVAVLSAAVGTWMALLLYSSGARPTLRWIGALLLPLFWPPFMTAIGWMVVQGENGITLFQRESFDQWGLSLLFSPLGVIAVHSLSFWSLPTLISWWGFLRLDREVVEPLRLEGVSLTRTSVHLCRLNLSPILTSSLLVAVLSLGEVGVPELLQVNTFPLFLYSELNLVRTLAPILRLSAPLLIFMVVGMIAWSVLRKRIRIESESFETLTHPNRWISPSWATAFLLVLLVLGPGIVLLTETLQTIEGVSTIHLALLTECLTASILTGLGAVFLSAIGLYLGLLFSRTPLAETVVDGAAFFFFVLPSPILALTLLAVTARIGSWTLPLLDSFWILSLACALHFYWVAWMLLRSGKERISQTLRDRMEMEGLKSRQRVWHVFLPLLRIQSLTGLYFIWVLSVGEVTLTRILQPPGIQTLAARTVNFMHWGHDGMVAAGLLMVGGLEFLPLMGYLGWKTLTRRTG